MHDHCGQTIRFGLPTSQIKLEARNPDSLIHHDVPFCDVTISVHESDHYERLMLYFEVGVRRQSFSYL